MCLQKALFATTRFVTKNKIQKKNICEFSCSKYI